MNPGGFLDEGRQFSRISNSPRWIPRNATGGMGGGRAARFLRKQVRVGKMVALLAERNAEA